MFLSTISRLLSAWFAFLLPCYATYKSLSRRPLSEAELQNWCIYWSVIGAFIAFEYIAEWFVSWLPFYWEAKTVFLLFLSLPQIQGSKYIYFSYLQPFFSQNETELDTGVIAMQGKALLFAQSKLAALWDVLSGRRQTQLSPSITQLYSFFSRDLWSSAMGGARSMSNSSEGNVNVR